MPPISSFVPSDEIRKLTFGSYESLRTKIEESIEKSKSRLFGSDSAVQVLSTFAGHAIVVSDDAKVFRVKFEESQGGEILPVSCESISVPVYKPENMDSFAQREARAFVDSFFSGARSAATEKFQNLLPVVKEGKSPSSPDKMLEGLSLLVKSEREWKKVYGEKLAEVRLTLSDTIKSLDESRLETKFRKLYDGGVSASEVPGYRDLVISDLKYLGERIDTTLAAAEQALVKWTVPATKANDAPVKAFKAFAEDFVADLRGVKNHLVETTKNLVRVPDFGKAYDAVAEELHRYEVAARFVEKMSLRLSEASTEE